MMERPEPPDQAAFDAYLTTLDWTGCERLYMPTGQFTGPMRKAIVDALPKGAGFCFNYEADQVWVQVSKPGATAEVVGQARATLGE